MCRYTHTLDPKSIPDFEAVVAGFPCQPFSSSGTRHGLEHSSGNAFLSVLSLIEQRRPKIVILENVVGLLSTQWGFAFATIIRSLSHLGYSVEWMVTNSLWFGAAQNRERIFLIAVPLNSVKWEKNLFGDFGKDYDIQSQTLFRSVVSQVKIVF